MQLFSSALPIERDTVQHLYSGPKFRQDSAPSAPRRSVRTLSGVALNPLPALRGGGQPRGLLPDAVFVGHGDAGCERVELHHGGDTRVPVEEDLIIQPGNTCGGTERATAQHV